jgi:ATP-dependent helicase/DNAse subunit B
LLAGLRGRASHSASALESWTACPVGWFVDRALDPGELQPDEMVLTRGRVAHDALAAVLTGLRERTGSARLDAASLPIARQLLDEALGEVGAPLSIDQAVDRSERNRQRQDLARYLEFAAAHPSDLEPGAFELGFGLPDAELPSAVLADGGLELCGRIDRLDFDRSGAALIYDYKAGSGDIPGVKWRELGRLQPALYMLAVEQLLGVDALGGLYQALRVKDLRPRGAIRADVDPDGALMDNDRFTPGDLRALVLERLDAAVLAASEMEAGALRPRPSTCWRDGVCRHPAICRAHSR